jgi:hypothetical protein
MALPVDFGEDPDDAPSKGTRVRAWQLYVSSASPGFSGMLPLSSQHWLLLADAEERSGLASYVPTGNVRVGAWIFRVGVEGGALRPLDARGELAVPPVPQEQPLVASSLPMLGEGLPAICDSVEGPVLGAGPEPEDGSLDWRSCCPVPMFGCQGQKE